MIHGPSHNRPSAVTDMDVLDSLFPWLMQLRVCLHCRAGVGLGLEIKAHVALRCFQMVVDVEGRAADELAEYGVQRQRLRGQCLQGVEGRIARHGPLRVVQGKSSRTPAWRQ